jgi:PA domain-containing protein
LIQRGGCFYGIKVLNAQAAGAAGVIIFNEGNPGRTDATPGVFFDPAGNEFIPTIPVAFASFAVGSDLYNQYQQAFHDAAPLPVVSLSISAIIDPNRDDYNVIADSKGGDKNHVMLVDAHLDAI